MLDSQLTERRAPKSKRVTLARKALRVWYRLHRVVREGLKFATVGGIGYVFDITIFNALLFSGGEGPLHDQPLLAKTLSVIVATIVTYIGHRAWTFRHRAQIKLAWGYPLFFLFNGIGLGIALGCLGISRYLLNLSGPLADNISANVVGLIAGTLFRYWAYRTWVFPAHPRPATVPAASQAGPESEPANA